MVCIGLVCLEVAVINHILLTKLTFLLIVSKLVKNDSVKCIPCKRRLRSTLNGHKRLDLGEQQSKYSGGNISLACLWCDGYCQCWGEGYG